MGGVARVEVVHPGEITANRVTVQPGFHWTEHVKPVGGTDLCEIRHTGYVVSGRTEVRMVDGTGRELAAGDAFDQPYISVDFGLNAGAATPLKR